jgi:hypothetical protein
MLLLAMKLSSKRAGAKTEWSKLLRQFHPVFVMRAKWRAK